MKKIISALFIMIGQVFIQAECQEPLIQETSWKDSIMAHWYNLSQMHKMIVYGIVILTLLVIIYRLIKCGFSGCGGSCNCNK